MKVLLLACALVVVGCANKPAAHECVSGIVCPDPLQCAAVQAVCISNSCGNGIVDPGEVCDDGNIMDGDGCSGDCKSAEACGDHVVNTEAGEVCDDGNNVDGDGCSHDCKSLEQCGNGIVDINEICDDGNTHNGTCGDGHVCDSNADCTVGSCTPDGCASDCKSNETCGNGIKDLGEVCDDGHAPGGCEDDCQHGVGCGNGVLDSGEECDDGNLINTDDCSANCKINVCGDGIVDSTGITHHETCDPGSNGVAVETAGCNIDCTTPSCGDGKVNTHFLPDGVHGEQCDLGTVSAVNQNKDSADCTAACQVNVCGDGKQDTTGTRTEGCDDGNRIDTDACRNDCKAATCGDGIVQVPSAEQCDDGNTNDLDGCRNNCTFAFCGDGAQDNGEACDPTAPHVGSDHNGNILCNSDCTVSACGDGKLNTHAGETCDDGNTSDNDGCLSSSTTAATTCKVAQCGDGKIFTGVEQCDTGNTTDTSGCYAAKCTFSSCGDGHTNIAAGEACDEGPLNGTPGHCNAFCQNPSCGNGLIDNGEQCDVTGHPDTSACDSDCSLPACGDGHLNTAFKPDGTHAEQCDNGINNTNDADCPYNTSCANRCSTTCQTIVPHVPTCGDGIIDSGHETCDDSGATNSKTECGYPSLNPCLACHTCTITALPPEFCGDGAVQATHEDCEPPNTTTCGPTCHNPTCADGAKNGAETDTDCGGATCDGLGDKCVDTKSCLVDNDCTNGYCDATNHCATPTCSDGVKNHGETDTDCGGPICDAANVRCADTEKCTADADCQNGYCNVGVSPHVCATPTCTDLVKNGGESGVDCGGTSTCGGCPGDPCTIANDCHSLSCSAGGTCN